MIDVQVGAKHIIDIIELKLGIAESVQPRLLWEVHRRCIALVLPGAGVHQNRMFRGSHHIGLIGDHQPAGDRIEHLGIEFGEMPPSGVRVIGRKHVLGPPPWPVPLDDAGDGNIADVKLAHPRSPPVSPSLPRKPERLGFEAQDRKSPRLNSSHVKNSYAVFCLKKKKKNTTKILLKKKKKTQKKQYINLN